MEKLCKALRAAEKEAFQQGYEYRNSEDDYFENQDNYAGRFPYRSRIPFDDS